MDHLKLPCKGHPLTPPPCSHRVILPRNSLWLPAGGRGMRAAVEQRWGWRFLHQLGHSPQLALRYEAVVTPSEVLRRQRVSSLPLSDFHLLGLTLWGGSVLLCPHGADLRGAGHGLPLFRVPSAGVLVLLALLFRIRRRALLRAGVVTGRCLVPGGRTGRGACSAPPSTGCNSPALGQVEKCPAKA